MDSTIDGLNLDFNDADYENLLRPFDIDDPFAEFFAPQDFIYDNQAQGGDPQPEVPCADQSLIQDQSGQEIGTDVIAAR